MAIPGHPFSMSTMSNGLQNVHCYPKGISYFIPPPGFSTPLNHSMNSLFHLMTSCESVAQFKQTIANHSVTELERMALMLTSDLDYFLEILTNQYGSKRVQKLLGKSDDADAYFSTAILRRFLQIMTDKYAYHVAVRAILVVQPENKHTMYEYTLLHALDLARDQYGCLALNEVITDIDDPYYRNHFLNLIECNARFLSNDVSGNFVVQHMFKLNDLRCTHNIALNLRGHYVDLSFQKYGSYIVERLLEVEDTNILVVEELLYQCEGDRLMRLARNEFGNFVVNKALRVTQEMTRSRTDLFWGLVTKLMPFLHLLGRSRGSSNIVNILESALQDA